MNRTTQTSFDQNTAKETIDSFAFSCAVTCRLYHEDGRLLYEQNVGQHECAFCHQLSAITGVKPNCRHLHQHAAKEAVRFGGRYIYFCPMGLTYFSSPIITGGSVSGSFVGGPALITDEEDLFADLAPGCLSPDELETLLDSVRDIPKMEPARLSYLSNQLFASAVYVSDSTHELFLVHRDNRQQASIGAYIQQFKSDRLAKLYPTETEHDLVDAISNGNFENGERCLNELIGYHLFSSADPDTLHTRMSELVAVMGRSALYSGANSEQVFAICHRVNTQLLKSTSNESMSGLLLESLGQFTQLVYHLKDSKHKNIIHRSINYIIQNCGQKLTLSQVAEYAGYAPSYYSKIFKEEMGCTFQTFLNRVRVDKSKSLLLSSTMSNTEISGLVGFEDQSYFGKVFKRVTGVTPDQYRKRKRRIDEARERDKSRH